MLPIHLIHECALYMNYCTFIKFITLLNDDYDVERLKCIYCKKLHNEITKRIDNIIRRLDSIIY